ncbi:MAG: acylphosphatase [Acidihalobacter sp.]|jgi:acylphosphatase
MHEAMRCLVRGRVQGVSFRAAACARGDALGLQGYARNLPDGGVEVYAQGAPEALAALRRWLTEGPPLARVDGLECAEAPSEPVSGFSIRY